MKICLIVIGGTHKKWARDAETEYAGRISRYIGFEELVIPDIKASKKMSEEQQKVAEGRQIIERLQSSDFVVLLDERGRQMESVNFADELQGYMNRGVKRLVFVVGGPYGFSSEVYERASGNLLGLSKMTFPHDLVRVIFLEQLYRAFTIIRNEPYHHQ